MGIIVIALCFLFFLAFCSSTSFIILRTDYNKLKNDYNELKQRLECSENMCKEENYEISTITTNDGINELLDSAKKQSEDIVSEAMEQKENILNMAILEAKRERDKIISSFQEERDKIIYEANLEKDEILRKANNESVKIVDVAKCRAKQIIESANETIEKSKECIQKYTEREEYLNRRAKDLESKERHVKWNQTRSENIRKEAIGIKKEAEEIREDMYKISDEYMVKLRERMQEMINQVHISNEFDFECASMELKEKLKRHEFNMKERRFSFASIDYNERHHEENKLKELALCYCDVLIDALIGKVGKIGLDKVYKKMRESIVSVEELMPKILKFSISSEYIIAKKEQLALIAEIERYKAQKREERKLKLQAEREERQAQKELEAERKRAEKDMIAAEAAIEKNRIAIALSKSEEEKQKYKEQVLILEESLKKSQERHERALSMAQQTRCGYVYVISNVGSFGEGVYKIGMTRRVNPMDRVVELGDASVPFPFDVHAMIYTDDAPGLESALHRAFENRKINAVNYRKEYFNVPLDEIKEEVAKQGVLYDEWINEPIAAQWRDSARE